VTPEYIIKNQKSQENPKVAEENYYSSNIIHLYNDSEVELAKNQYNWTGIGTFEDPIIIQYMNFSTSGIVPSLYLENISKYIIIRNNLFTSGRFGIIANNISNVRITQNTFKNIQTTGITFERSQNISILNNTIETIGSGIILNHCDSPLIQNNSLKNLFGNAIKIEGTTMNAIIDDNFFENVYGAISTSDQTINVVISNNLINASAYASIIIGHPSNTTIISNTICNSIIFFTIRNFNPEMNSIQIFRNNFLFHDNPFLFDVPIWNVSISGNFYAVWVEPDEDQNGVVDEPYRIPIFDGRTGYVYGELYDSFPMANLYPEYRMFLYVAPKFKHDRFDDSFLLIEWTPCRSNTNFSVNYTLYIYSDGNNNDNLLWSGVNQTKYLWKIKDFLLLVEYRIKLRVTIIDSNQTIMENDTIYSPYPVNSYPDFNPIQLNKISYISTRVLTGEWNQIFDSFNNSANFSILLHKGLVNKHDLRKQDYIQNVIAKKDIFILILKNNTNDLSIKENVENFQPGFYTVVVQLILPQLDINYAYGYTLITNTETIFIIFIGIVGLTVLSVKFLITKKLERLKAKNLQIQ
jgi:hypothetical protein